MVEELVAYRRSKQGTIVKFLQVRVSEALGQRPKLVNRKLMKRKQNVLRRY